MKKLSFLLALVLLVTVAGCRKQEDLPEVEQPPVEETEDPVLPQGPLQLETLRLEITRYDGDTELVLRAARELPDLLQQYFAEAETPVEIGKVRVTVGYSAAATAQSLAQGGVDMAFLSAETFALCGGAQVLLGNAPQPAIRPDGDSTNAADWNGEKTYVPGHTMWAGGTASLICAAPTEYGRQLAKRAGNGTALTWKELDHARWGVLEADSDGGYRCADLYLADNYEGNRISDLTQVRVYDSYEELLRAAAEGAVDVIVLRMDARMDAAEAWTLEFGRTDKSGMTGFGRTEPVWQEVACIAVTETLYTTVAAATPELANEEFLSALTEVLERLYDEEPELMGVLGSAHFVPVEDDDLDALRRTLTIEGKTA